MRLIIIFLFVIATSANAQIVVKKGTPETEKPTRCEAFSDGSERFLERTLQLSAFVGTTVVKHVPQIDYRGKNNFVHYGAQLRVGNSSAWRALPFIAVQYYNAQLSDSSLAQNVLEGKKDRIRNTTLFAGIDFPVYSSKVHKLYLQSAVLLGELAIPRDAFVTRYSGLNLGLGYDRLLAKYLTLSCGIYYENNRETKHYRSVNAPIDLDVLRFQVGLRF